MADWFINMPKSKPPTIGWTYGKHPNPNTWQVTADILKGMQKPKPSSGLMEKLTAIHDLLKK